MRFQKDIFKLVMVLALLAGKSALAQADPLACGGGGMLSDFSHHSASRGFAAAQKQNGAIGLQSDPNTPSNQVARMAAGPKGRRVGKAALIHRYAPVGVGNVIDMSARFYFPDGEQTDSIILMDLECASCGLDTNPGLRLYLRDGRLRVDRSKIGIKDPFYPSVDHEVRTGVWQDVRWRVELGDQDRGLSEVFLDGRRVGSNRGTTVLTQRIVSQITNINVREEVDRFQIGLTANSNRRRTEMLIDDVRFCIGR